MSDPVEDFFQDLAQRSYEPLLQHITGSIRFDLLDADQVDHWWVGIDRGRLTVCHEDRDAGSVTKEERSTFADVILGRRNAMTTFLRGDAGYAGDGEPLVVFQRLFGERDRQGVWS
jgi:hypothetical protein